MPLTQSESKCDERHHHPAEAGPTVQPHKVLVDPRSDRSGAKEEDCPIRGHLLSVMFRCLTGGAEAIQEGSFK